MFAPDILWKLFFETVLIVVWGGIAYGFETLQAA
jgi:hypothetical protein